MPWQRHLDPSEAYHAFVDWSGSYSIEVAGSIDSDLLVGAFEALCDAVPLLSGSLGRDEHGFFFRIPPGRRPEIRVRDTDGTAQHQEAVYLEEMGSPLDSTRELCRLVLVRGDRRGHLILVLHHSMIDGRGGVTLLEKLCRNYTALSRGEQPPYATPPAVPQASAETLLKERGAARGAEPAVDRAALRAALAAAPSPAHLTVVPERVRLDQRHTAGLIESLRAEGFSVHGFVAGVATVALREGRPQGGALDMVCGCPVDLRNRVEPPVTVEESTNFVSGVEASVAVPRHADPMEIGRVVKERLDKAIDSGEAEHAILQAGQFTAATPVSVDLVVTNLGPIPPFTTPDGLRVTDFRGYTTTTMPGLLLFVVTSYDGRLSVELTSPHDLLSGPEREALKRRAAELLSARNANQEHA
ncbi:Condensation domain-containing protein [Streptomyces sp. yr375]|uniref:phthiocerol/phthiodiolone dimycocerosyl transferase family protein n=1 Tax=Streptomyces sp. yr375 TaxID=1761906 RepID=UPI0008BE6880|nr:condensation domain-containing protein [Streptomyces sp. yr375]SEQ48347.1 Condensation domain-containing protein [Streptomyces sp. yr375]